MTGRDNPAVAPAARSFALAAAFILLVAGHDSVRADQSPPRATLYAFFATWCVPCRVELPHLQRFYEKYAERGLRVVLVSEDDPSSAENVPAFLARFGVSAPWILDNESELIERYNPSANLPYTVLLDASGKVAYAHAGYEPGDEERVEAEIQKLLSAAEPADAPVDKSRVRITSTTQSLGAYRTSQFDSQIDGTLRAGLGRIEVAGEFADPGFGQYRASVRVDGALVSDEADDMEDLRDVRLERAKFSADMGRIALAAGDGYVSFGHGVTLSLRKIDPLGLDNSLRGGRVDARSDRVSALVLAGWTNPQNFDLLDFHIDGDEDSDFLTGAEITLRLGERGEVSPYALYAEADGAGDDGRDVSWMVAGASTALTLGPFRLAAEAAGGTREGKAFSAGGTETAWAAYGSAQWTRGPVTTLIDAKAYRHWAIGRNEKSLLYHEPPTLERYDQAVPTNEDVVGARVRTEWRLHKRATVFANLLGYLYSEDTTDPVDGDLAVHSYVGGDIRFGESPSVAGELGYRRENTSDGERKRSVWHVDADGSWRLPGRFALTAKWNHSEEYKRTFQGKDFRRGLTVVGLSRSGWGVLSWLYGYTTELDSTPTHYPGGELLVHLPRGGNLRLFVGRLAGGIVCVSGTCRDVPPFSGARVDLNLQI
ncbi:MAG: TlpA family protein disulfide reductase [Proteobacteria bacterium]|nr:TlpA family protein disulfide reductase [Pseudomonadota bacterium]